MVHGNWAGAAAALYLYIALISACPSLSAAEETTVTEDVYFVGAFDDLLPPNVTLFEANLMMLYQGLADGRTPERPLAMPEIRAYILMQPDDFIIEVLQKLRWATRTETIDFLIEIVERRSDPAIIDEVLWKLRAADLEDFTEQHYTVLVARMVEPFSLVKEGIFKLLANRLPAGVSSSNRRRAYFDHLIAGLSNSEARLQIAGVLLQWASHLSLAECRFIHDTWQSIQAAPGPIEPELGALYAVLLSCGSQYVDGTLELAATILRDFPRQLTDAEEFSGTLTLMSVLNREMCPRIKENPRTLGAATADIYIALDAVLRRPLTQDNRDPFQELLGEAALFYACTVELDPDGALRGTAQTLNRLAMMYEPFTAFARREDLGRAWTPADVLWPSYLDCHLRRAIETITGVGSRGSADSKRMITGALSRALLALDFPELVARLPNVRAQALMLMSRYGPAMRDAMAVLPALIEASGTALNELPYQPTTRTTLEGWERVRDLLTVPAPQQDLLPRDELRISALTHVDRIISLATPAGQRASDSGAVPAGPAPVQP